MNEAGNQSPVAVALRRLAAGEPIDAELAAAAFGQLMKGEASDVESAGLLSGLRARGETIDEVTGAVRAVRAAMITVETRDLVDVIDTCGTGGGTVPTFNISTVAALVAVGAGASVAKHGNRSYTSKCGSADVLEALGVEISVDASRAAQLLERAGMAFLFAPAFHPAMRHLGPVRKQLGIPTVMNMIGPLANPAGVGRQVVGVADSARAPILAEVLRRVGAQHALVVHGTVGMDEIAPQGTTDVWEVRAGQLTTWTIDPAEFGLVADVDRLAGGLPAENAARVELLLSDPEQDSAGRAAVLLNAGAALYVAGLADDLPMGIEKATEALDGGAGLVALNRLRDESATCTSE